MEKLGILYDLLKCLVDFSMWGAGVYLGRFGHDFPVLKYLELL